MLPSPKKLLKICSELCFEVVVNQNSHMLAPYNGHFDPVLVYES